jgi:hypothetical protein
MDPTYKVNARCNAGFAHELTLSFSDHGIQAATTPCAGHEKGAQPLKRPGPFARRRMHRQLEKFLREQ